MYAVYENQINTIEIPIRHHNKLLFVHINSCSDHVFLRSLSEFKTANLQLNPSHCRQLHACCSTTLVVIVYITVAKAMYYIYRQLLEGDLIN